MEFQFAAARMFNPVSYAERQQRKRKRQPQRQAQVAIAKSPDTSHPTTVEILAKTTSILAPNHTSSSSRQPECSDWGTDSRLRSPLAARRPKKHKWYDRHSEKEQSARRSSLQGTHCGLCGSSQEILQCTKCPEVLLCFVCVRKKTFAHPYPDHAFLPLEKSAETTALLSNEGHPDVSEPFRRNLCPHTIGADTDKAPEPRSRDLEGNTTAKDLGMAREGVSEASSDTLAVASDRRRCGFCKKCLVVSWFECQDCTSDANFCQPCSFLHFPQHTLKAVFTHGEGADAGSAYHDDTAGVDVEHPVDHQDDVDFQLMGRDVSEAYVSVEKNSIDAELSEEIVDAEPESARDTEPSEDIAGAGTETDDEAEISEDVAGAEPDNGGETESSDAESVSDDMEVTSSSYDEGVLESQASQHQKGRRLGVHRKQPRGGQHTAPVDTLLDVRRRLGRAMNEISAAVKLLQEVPADTADRAALSANLLDMNASLAMYSLPSPRPRKNAQIAHARWSARDRHQLSKMKKKGYTDEEIGKTLNRTSGAVTQQWRKQRAMQH